MARRLFILLFASCIGCTDIGPADATVCVSSGFDLEQRTLISAAVEEWRADSGGKLTPDVRDGDDTNCDVVLSGHPNMVSEGGGIAGGRTSYRQGWIHLNNSIDPGMFWTSVLHELGHYWTGEDHSAAPSDVMYWEAADPWKHLTAGDLSRLQ